MARGYETVSAGLNRALRAADLPVAMAGSVALAKRLAAECDDADPATLIRLAPALLKALEALGMTQAGALGRGGEGPGGATPDGPGSALASLRERAAKRRAA